MHPETQKRMRGIRAKIGRLVAAENRHCFSGDRALMEKAVTARLSLERAIEDELDEWIEKATAYRGPG